MAAIRIRRSKMILSARGFTLIELLITLVISSLLMGVVFGVYKVQQDHGLAQEQVTQMQQNLRVGLNTLAREARNAGYDPSGYGAKIEDAVVKAFQFSYDNDDGGVNTRRFERYPTDNDDIGYVRMHIGGSAVANNIEKLQFEYLDSNNTVLSGTFDKKDIISLRIYMLARADKPDRNFTNTATYILPLADYSVNDNFRRRLQVITVKLRNMGLSNDS